MVYAIPNVRTNYGIFNMKFARAKVWNWLDAELKTLSIKAFNIIWKEKLLTEIFTQADIEAERL